MNGIERTHHYINISAWYREALQISEGTARMLTHTLVRAVE
jgi:hypothetical protein